MAQFEQWSGFNGRLWKEEDSGKRKLTFVTSSRTTTHHMKVMNLSWLDLQRQLTNYGESFRNCRKKSVQKAAFWIWRQK